MSPQTRSLFRALSTSYCELGALLVVALSYPTTDLLYAADSTSTWTSATSGDWDVAANWTPNTFFPNNGNGGFATHDAVINAAGADYTVTLDTNVTVEDLTINSANASLRHTTGTVTATDGIDLLAGTYRLEGAIISATTINQLGGTMRFTGGTSRLINNTVLVGDANVDVRLQFESGSTFTGNATLIGNFSNLTFRYTTTLDNKTINMDGIETVLGVDADNTLTLGPNMLVRGRGSVRTSSFSATTAVVNQGTIRADVSGNFLVIGEGLQTFTNENIVETTGGGRLQIDAASWTNAGDINVGAGSLANFRGSWNNAAGTVSVGAGSTLALAGAFTTDGLGIIDNTAGGTVTVGGTWNNSGENFTFNATTGSWQLASGGNVSGGTITPGAGGQTLRFSSGGRLSNNAVFDGDLNFDLSTGNLRLESGATFTADANLTAGSTSLQFHYTTTLDNKTINLDGSGAALTVEGDNTLTLGPNLVVRGRGNVRTASFANTTAIINQGTIRADLAGVTLAVGLGLDTVTNGNTVEATGGGILSIDSGVAGVVTNVSGNTLTGGTWRAVGNGSRVDLDAAQIQTNAAEIILDGIGSAFRSATLNTGAIVNLEASLVTNAAGGTLRILGGRNYAATAGGSFVNSGDVELGGGTFSAPTISNTATGEIFGHGTISNTILNSGVVRAAGGTLIVGGAGIDGQSGTIQIDASATLDLSGATADSDADFLVHNGAGLNLGANDVLVGSDYTNANFGVGNAFNHRTNVTSAGQINANPAVTQTLGGNVTNGATVTATMDFGNVHVGSSTARNYQINNVGASGPSLRGAVQTTVGGANLTDARLTGAGVTASNFGPIAAGGNSGNRAVTFNATAAGALTNQRVGIVNNFDNVADQTLEFTGAAYRLASPTAHTPEPVNFGIVHVGDVLQQALSITNNVPNDGFSERLNASIGSPTGAATTNGGSFTALVPGATNNTSLVVGVNTATAGAKSGTATITLTSNGAGTSGLANTALASQTVNVSAQVNNFAVANMVKISGDGTFTMNAPNDFTLDLGLANLGATDLAAQLAVANTAAAPADSLAGSFTLAAPDFTLTGFGPFSGIAAGAQHGGLMVGLDTSTVGEFNGLITLQPQSTNPRPFSMNLAPIMIHLVGEVRLFGDYNEDGSVDAADYVVWRKNDGTPAGHNTWRANFGQTAGSGATSHLAPGDSPGANSSVPEPASTLLLIAAIAVLAWFRKRR